MTTRREFAYYIGGVTVGFYGPKLLPKLKPVKLAIFYKEAFSARRRLQKIVIEEYYRIDDAIETELAFLKMIDPNVTKTPVHISFEVVDNDGNRDVKLNFEYNPKT